MKKVTLIALLALGLGQVVRAQNRFFTRDGHVEFLSETPIENIEATNDKVTCVVDMETGAFEFAVLIKSFEFEKALMEEHFNENYMESNAYPKATFVGTIEGLAGIRDSGFPPGVELRVKGKMTIHGVTKEVVIVGYIEKEGDGYKLMSNFIVHPEDYKIEIPNTVRESIAKEIHVTIEATLKALTK
jgi:polyisoprenoid-binding protein YceI